MTTMTFMTTPAIHDDFQAMRTRFHRALAISLAVHALLAVGLTAVHGSRAVLPRIVEVTWLEAPVVEQPATKTMRTESPTSAEAAPRPAKAPERTVADAARRREQLAQLAATRDAVARELQVAPPAAGTRELLAGAPTGGSDLTRVAAAATLPVADIGRPVALARGTEVKATALALARGPAVAGGSLTAAAAIPVATIGSRTDREATAAQAAAAAREVGVAPGDILLAGPAADRPVLASRMPDYPGWARRQAVESSVTLHFIVLPDGRVREDVQVLRTGGFSDFDERATAALRQWRFAALSGGDAAGQWGTITFRFRLRG